MNKNILIIYFGDFYFDARCINMALSLLSGNNKVSIISTYKKKYPFDCLKKIKSIKLTINNNKLKYFHFYTQVNKIIKNQTYDRIICGDLYSLASGCRYSNGATIIYDCREIYSDLFAHQKKPWLKILCFLYEKKFLRSVNKIIVTAKSDYQYLKKKYPYFPHLDWYTIYNYPKYQTIQTLKNENKNIKILYQGVLQRGRGIKKLIHLVQKSQNISAFIIGGGEEKTTYVNLVNKLNLNNQIMFSGAVPYLDLFKYSSDCDLGWAMIKNVGDSNLYALPNKLFEYTLMGLPVIASDLPNMKKIIQQHNLGIISSNHLSLDELKNKIITLFQEKYEKNYYHNITKKHFSWNLQHDDFMKVINE